MAPRFFVGRNSRSDHDEERRDQRHRRRISERMARSMQAQIVADERAMEFIGRLMHADERAARPLRRLIEPGEFIENLPGRSHRHDGI